MDSIQVQTRFFLFNYLCLSVSRSKSLFLSCFVFLSRNK